ncbi:baculoviral IAP repeat-containing protein 2 [Apostichopus japonicus]|uniref:Baculoviral IAP repeat-containing protein 2 n=1 Tax=Stichopus japonicus TaxID=307972 RepID=A0A2G8LN51_STIJA|nr:baculoviral IAP repeat-containing protein 2 [Apostichopus japonicus]
MERHHERNRGDIDGMNIESQRVKSFENTSWPENIPVTIYRLANAGFYFTGIDDEVKCFSCLIIIRDWKQGDSPKGRHKRSSPRCRFVQGIDARNIADVKYVLKSGNSSKRLPLQHKIESNGKDCVTLLKDRVNAGVEDKTACSKGYQFERNRLRTFQDFPLSCPVDPYELSASGFYMQNNYAVQCFACFVRIPYSSWKIWRPTN